MRTTVKGIAEVLNISRNTVSKVINDQPGVSPETRKLVLEKIREMNYQNFLDMANESKSKTIMTRGSILFLTSASVNNSDFWINVMKGIESVLDEQGFNLVLGVMQANEIDDLKFPTALTDRSVEGVILVELPSLKVCNELIEKGIPTVFVDPPCGNLVGRADIVIMENRQNLRKIIRMLVEAGHYDFGFAGEVNTENVGMGFRERYEALVNVLEELQLSLDPSCSFLCESPDSFLDHAKIIAKLKVMKKIPSVFVCGNDLTAIHLMKSIKSLGLRVPEDVAFVGFDNIHDSQTCSPPLTTVNTPKEYIGMMAANKLIARIEHPDIPYEYSQYSTQLVIRESTGKLLST